MVGLFTDILIRKVLYRAGQPGAREQKKRTHSEHTQKKAEKKQTAQPHHSTCTVKRTLGKGGGWLVSHLSLDQGEWRSLFRRKRRPAEFTADDVIAKATAHEQARDQDQHSI